MKLLFTSILLIFVCHGFAQRQNVYFFKNNGKRVDTRDSADYLRVIREPDSASTLYNAFEFYKDGKKKMIGKSSTINPLTLEGQCIRYYSNGSKQNVANYKKGRIVGIEVEYYSNGKVYIAKQYPDSTEMNDPYHEAFLIKFNNDSLGNVLVENGNGYYKGYDKTFKYIEEEGPVKNGKRDGAWKGYEKDFSVNFIENYTDGQLITGVATYEDGGIVNYKKYRGVPPQFKGGLDAFYKYLSTTIQYPVDARKNNIEGRVMVDFVVDKKGKVGEVKVAQSVSPSIDEEAIRVIAASPLWVAGTMFGRPVRCSYDVPLSFTLSN